MKRLIPTALCVVTLGFLLSSLPVATAEEPTSTTTETTTTTTETTTSTTTTEQPTPWGSIGVPIETRKPSRTPHPTMPATDTE